jgi:hypothetical protein
MSLEDFLTTYKKAEYKEIKLTTWKGEGDGIIHIRALPYSEVSRFHEAAEKIMQKRALGVFSEKAISYDEELGRAEDYLIKASVCDSQGVKLFDNDKSFNDWCKHVSNETVNEIIAHIRDLTDLSKHFKIENIEAEHKKKLESSDLTQTPNSPLS